MGSPTRAAWFLVWFGLLPSPHLCGRGHEWTRFSTNGADGKGGVSLHCAAKVPCAPRRDDEDEDDENIPPGLGMYWRGGPEGGIIHCLMGFLGRAGREMY